MAPRNGRGRGIKLIDETAIASSWIESQSGCVWEFHASSSCWVKIGQHQQPKVESSSTITNSAWVTSQANKIRRINSLLGKSNRLDITRNQATVQWNRKILRTEWVGSYPSSRDWIGASTVIAKVLPISATWVAYKAGAAFLSTISHKVTGIQAADTVWNKRQWVLDLATQAAPAKSDTRLTRASSCRGCVALGESRIQQKPREHIDSLEIFVGQLPNKFRISRAKEVSWENEQSLSVVEPILHKESL